MGVNEDTVRIKHLFDAANKAVEFAKDKTRGDLDKDEKLALALVRLIEILGEAANGLSEAFKEKASRHSMAVHYRNEKPPYSRVF